MKTRLMAQGFNRCLAGKSIERLWIYGLYVCAGLGPAGEVSEEHRTPVASLLPHAHPLLPHRHPREQHLREGSACEGNGEEEEEAARDRERSESRGQRADADIDVDIDVERHRHTLSQTRCVWRETA